MGDWSSIQEMMRQLEKKWQKGYPLLSTIGQKDFLPHSMKLRHPTTNDCNENLTDVIRWAKEIRRHEKTATSLGYRVDDKTFRNSITGKNTLPIRIVIDTMEDCVFLLQKEKELSWFLHNHEKMIAFDERLTVLLSKHPLQYAQDVSIERILLVANFFLEHEVKELYLRQLTIDGIDTKFVEQNQSILADFLDILLPQNKIQSEESDFEKRYFLRKKPILVRFRLLDPSLGFCGITDFTVPLAEFSKAKLPVETVFIVENETNFLSFPNVKNACLIFGKGYGVGSLREANWLQHRNIYYWGDLDTHGFKILSEVRKFLPHLQSFLMDEATLLSHKNSWVVESAPHLESISNLTDDEYYLVCKLQSNVWGESVRLEQEMISFVCLEEFLETLVSRDV